MRRSCREASQLMSRGQDETLAFGQRTALRLHLLICTACTRAKAQFAFMRRAAREYPGPDDDVPPKN